MLRKFERELLESGWEEVEAGIEVKLCTSPDNANETFLLCRSAGRKEKDDAMVNRFLNRLEAELGKLREQAAQGTLRDRHKAERRIGRLLERNSRAAGLFDITVDEPGEEKDKRLQITITKREDRYEWVQRTNGNYILRTNWTEKDPKVIWEKYIQLTQVEDAFRISKSDLGIRPVFHQTQDRTQAHILVCFLALAMWRTLEQWMTVCGLGNAPHKLLEEMREVKSLDVLLPTRDKTIRLRTVTTAPQALKILLQRLKFPFVITPYIKTV